MGLSQKMEEMMSALGMTEVALIQWAYHRRSPALHQRAMAIEQQYKEETGKGPIACWLVRCDNGDTPEFVEYEFDAYVSKAGKPPREGPS